MPIKPENKDKYPKNWKEIRQQILDRAGHKCEFCGIPNYEIGYRDKKGRFHKEDFPCTGMTDYESEIGGKPVKIVLTIAHLDHNPENNDPDNLKALCQQCHNRHDIKHRIVTRAETRQSKEKAAGQEFLFEERE